MEGSINEITRATAQVGVPFQLNITLLDASNLATAEGLTSTPRALFLQSSVAQGIGTPSFTLSTSATPNGVATETISSTQAGTVSVSFIEGGCEATWDCTSILEIEFVAGAFPLHALFFPKRSAH